MPKYKKILTIVFSVVFMLECITTISFLRIFYPKRQSNTMDYYATVDTVQFIETEADRVVRILTKEYSGILVVSLEPEDVLFDETAFSNLQNGDRIQFQVLPFMHSLLDKGGIVEISVLKTDSKTIYALTEDNSSLYTEMKDSVIGSAITTSVALLLALVFGISLAKDYNKQKKTS